MFSSRPRFRRLLVAAFVALVSPSFASAAEKHDPGEFSIRSTPPLDAPKRERLRELVARDPEAAALFAEIDSAARALQDRQPRPLRVLHYEGLVNTDPRRVATVASLREMDDVALLLHHWQASADPLSAAALRRFILAWGEAYEPTGNDVNENKLHPLFVAYDALRDTFPAPERERLDAWIARLGALHFQAVRESRHLTNRYTKHIRLVAILGRILDREEWRQTAEAGLKRFVAESLRADGTSLDLERRDTLTYHASALRPVIELAVIAGPRGRALYEWESPKGGSIRKSVNYLVPYADGSKTREEWRNSRVDLDRRRAAEGLAAYQPGRLYDPKNALRVLEEASFFDPSLLPLVLRLHGRPAARFAGWTMVLNAAAADEPPATGLKDAYRDRFLVGVAVSAGNLADPDSPEARLISAHFNALTPENVMKWALLQPRPGEYAFEAADRLVEFAQAHGQQVVGHTLVWHEQTPAWVFTDEQGAPLSREALLARMRDHIHAVLHRYRGRVHAWDVVNEALNDNGTLRDTPWRRIIGDDYIEKAFAFAREADPAARLYYNDYRLEHPPKRDGAVAIVKRLQAAGLRIDGVGIQGHVSLDWPALSDLDASIKAFAALGVKVMITELDVDVLPATRGWGNADIRRREAADPAFNPYADGLPEEVQQRLAARYVELFKVYLENHDAVSRVTFWGLADKGSWLNNWPIRGRTNHPLLFDRELRPKPALRALLELARARAAAE
jgi:endo-1,4-beta-xylanase